MPEFIPGLPEQPFQPAEQGHVPSEVIEAGTASSSAVPAPKVEKPVPVVEERHTEEVRDGVDEPAAVLETAPEPTLPIEPRVPEEVGDKYLGEEELVEKHGSLNDSELHELAAQMASIRSGKS